jgi:hypothetical protein
MISAAAREVDKNHQPGERIPAQGRLRYRNIGARTSNFWRRIATRLCDYLKRLIMHLSAAVLG